MNPDICEHTIQDVFEIPFGDEFKSIWSEGYELDKVWSHWLIDSVDRFIWL